MKADGHTAEDIAKFLGVSRGGSAAVRIRPRRCRVDELLRRGIGLDEVCQHLGVSRDELGHLVGKDAVDRWAALNA